MILNTKKSVALVLAATAFSFGASAADDQGFRVGGFVDGQYQWDHNITSRTKGFALHDGALYLTHGVGNTKAMVDLPFGSSEDGTAVSIGLQKAQAYVEHKYDFGLRWKLGIFDTIYGFEANDSADIAFTTFSSVYQTVAPYTHTGLMLGYDFGPEFGVNYLIANTVNQTRQPGGDRPDLGLQVFYKTQMLRAVVGGTYQKTQGSQNLLLDVMLGTTLADFSADLNLIVKKDQEADASMGFLTTLGYNFSEMYSAGGRFSYVSKYQDKYQEFSFTVGPQAQMTKNLRIKLDYSLFNNKAVEGAAAETTHAVALAGVYRI